MHHELARLRVSSLSIVDIQVKYCSGNWIYDLHLGCEVQQGEDTDFVLCQMRRCTASHCTHWNSIFTNSALYTNMWHREICSADDQNSIQINISGSCLTSDSCISCVGYKCVIQSRS